MKKIAGLLVILIAFVFAGVFTVNMILNSQLNYTKTLSFEVKKGEGFNSVLYKISKKIPGFPLKSTKLYLKYTGLENKLKTGDYEIPKRRSAKQILNYLVKGQLIEKFITFQEGLNLYQVGELLESKGLCARDEFIKVATDVDFVEEVMGFRAVSLEGYIFPDTYKLPKKWNAKQYAKVFVKRFKQVWKEILKTNKVDISRHQTVILASLIEKETGAGFERPMISSVFHNRLKRSMKIQSDPTTLYGIWVKTGKMKKNITRKDLKTPTPYNTYTIKGLPLGPIANPGKAALRAALNPVTSNNLYFVSKNDGTHKFSKTYKEHLAGVKKYQLDPNARKGKSWRDLSKRKK